MFCSHFTTVWACSELAMARSCCPVEEIEELCSNSQESSVIARGTSRSSRETGIVLCTKHSAQRALSLRFALNEDDDLFLSVSICSSPMQLAVALTMFAVCDNYRWTRFNQSQVAHNRMPLWRNCEIKRMNRSSSNSFSSRLPPQRAQCEDGALCPHFTDGRMTFLTLRKMPLK